VPLHHYGVVIGTLQAFTRDPQHSFGRWYHGHIALDTPGGTWQSALDVDAPQAVGVAYRLVADLAASDLGPVADLAPGFHELGHSAGSGALDYVRSPALRDGAIVRRLRALLASSAPEGWTPPPPDVGLPGGPPPGEYPPAPFGPDRVDSMLETVLRLSHRLPIELFARIPRARWRSFPWIESNGDNALDALAPHLDAAQRIYIFGERFEDGTNGVHDVHMNQGDPAGSQWYSSNGIWQDGGVACQGAAGNVVIWQVRFKTQSLNTDDQGHPRTDAAPIPTR
jgi:Uncharacterized conserved protein (DUF2278)